MHTLTRASYLGMVLMLALTDASYLRAQVRPGGGIVAKNDLSQLALLYNQYMLEDPVPANLDALKANIKKDAPSIYTKIEKGQIGVIYHPRLAASLVLAYQKEAVKGMHLVVFGDRSVKAVTSDELKELLK